VLTTTPTEDAVQNNQRELSDENQSAPVPQ
jgi:hypothetical protein